jgi:hypothetical protein
MDSAKNAIRDSYRHVAVEGQRGTGRNVEAYGVRAGDYFQLFERDMRGTHGLAFQILPVEEDAGGVVRWRGGTLIQPLPQTVGGADYLRGFIPQNQRAVEQREYGVAARADQGNQ